jgi:hypothetical protein
MISDLANFERRHVLYCDVLGFSNYSLGKFFEPAKCLRLFRDLDELVAQASREIDPLAVDPELGRVPDYIVKPEAIYFSDSLVISTAPTNVDAIWLCEAAARIQTQLCYHGYLVRGSIVTGDVYHSGHTLFGPAIARAVEMEKRHRNPPVVVVSEETLSCFRHGTTERDKEIIKIREYQLIARNDSDTPYVDPFWLAKIHTNQSTLQERTQITIAAWRTLIESGLHNQPPIRRKYSWMARHFNRSLSGKASAIARIKCPKRTRQASLTNNDGK